MMLALISFDQGSQDVQFVTFRGAECGALNAFDSPQSSFVISFRPYGSNLHISPSSR
jgi:hypothetical protein